METNEEMYSQPAAMQKLYRDTIKEFNENYKNEFRKNDIDFITLSTSTPYDTALLSYLNKRKNFKFFFFFFFLFPASSQIGIVSL